MSAQPKRAFAEPIYNPYKRKLAEQGTPSLDLASLRKKPLSRSGIDTPASILDPKNSSVISAMATTKNFLSSQKPSATSTFENLQTPDSKKVFNFQLDPGFRMNLMRKRMNSKISIKQMADEPKPTLATPQPRIEPGFLHFKKQSLDVVKLAEEKALLHKEKKLEIETNKSHIAREIKDCDAKAHEVFDHLPNKQALIGLLDNQKGIGLTRTFSSKPPALNPESLDLKNSKGLFFPRSTMRNGANENKLLSFEFRRGPVSVVREVVGSSTPKGANGEEDQVLLTKEGNKDEMRKSTVSVDVKDVHRGYFDRVFKKKSSQQLLERGSTECISRKERASEEPKRQRSLSREVFEVKTQTYYMTSLKYNYQKKGVGPLAVQFKEHFIQTVGALNYLVNNKVNVYQYCDIELVKGKIKAKKTGKDFQGPRSLTNADDLPRMEKLSVVFDLDETLITVKQNTQKANFVMSVKIRDGNIIKLGVFYRPYLAETLEKIYKNFDLYIYTSSEKEYADMILKQIDPESRFFKKKFYKSSCQRAENGLYMKNLELVGQNLARTILVDNSTFSFGHQLLNGVPIVSFNGSDTDTELMSLQDYLLHLSKAPDVRKTNLEYFKYPVYMENLEQGPDIVFQKIFSQTS